jgi:hypothetical protein
MHSARKCEVIYTEPRWVRESLEITYNHGLTYDKNLNRCDIHRKNAIQERINFMRDALKRQHVDERYRWLALKTIANLESQL